MRKKRLKLGDIYEIPLPNGKNAYGRLYKETTLGIYINQCNSINELTKEEDYLFFVAVYKDLLQDGEWKVVGNRKFKNDEDAWAPPRCMVDAITKVGSIIYRGIVSECTYDECKDLELAAVWDRQHVIDRLMGDVNWMEFLDKPINPEK